MDARDTHNQAIQIIAGGRDALVVAPHGVMGDDDHTDRVALAMIRGYDFPGVVNSGYHRPRAGQDPDPAQGRIDCNRIDQVNRLPMEDFLAPILNFKAAMVESLGTAYTVFIHGAKDASLEDHARFTGAASPPGILIGFGQDSRKPAHTCPEPVVDRFLEHLNGWPHHPVNAEKTHPEYSTFRARHHNNLTQLFNREPHFDHRARTLQLEIGWTGYRDTDVNIRKTAGAIAEALIRLTESDAEGGAGKEAGETWI